MTLDETINDFAELLRLWSWGYCTAFRRYVVVRVDGEWRLASGIVALTSEASRDLPDEFVVETPNCIAGIEKEIINSEDIENLISSIASECWIFQTRDKNFSILSKSDQPRVHFYRSNHPQFSGPLRTPGLYISSTESHSLTIDVEGLDLELRSSDPPFDGTSDLAMTLGFRENPFSNISGPQIDIVAMPPLQFQDSKISKDGNLNAKVHVIRKPDLVKLKFAIKNYSKSLSFDRIWFSGTDFQWTLEGDRYIGEIERELEDVELVKIMPSYSGVNLGGMFLHVENFNLSMSNRIHKILFPENSVDKIIFSNDQNYFESGIAILLEFLNLKTIWYGGLATLSNGPDIMAYSNSGHIYVVECTLGDPDHKGKLLKLRTRTEMIKSRLEDDGLSVDLVRPVLVSALPRSETTEHWSSLKNYMISLVCRDELENLINRVENPPSDEELFNSALRAIPTSQDEPQGTLF